MNAMRKQGDLCPPLLEKIDTDSFVIFLSKRKEQPVNPRKNVMLGHVIFKKTIFTNSVNVKIRQFQARQAQEGTSGLDAAYILNFFLCHKVKLPSDNDLFEKFQQYAAQVNTTIFNLNEKQLLNLIPEDRRNDITIIDDCALELIKNKKSDYSGWADLLVKRESFLDAKPQYFLVKTGESGNWLPFKFEGKLDCRNCRVEEVIVSMANSCNNFDVTTHAAIDIICRFLFEL